jgi:hypothetical protein
MRVGLVIMIAVRTMLAMPRLRLAVPVPEASRRARTLARRLRRRPR